MLNKTSKYSKISILSKHLQRFSAGFPWVYANELEKSHETKSIEPGELVHLCYQGKILATGYYNRHSLISFRVLSRNPDEVIDCDFFVRRLKEAEKLRQNFYQEPYYRLVHADGDFLPGLIIDRFNDVFVVQANSQGMEKLRPLIIEALMKAFHVKTLYFKNDSPMRLVEGLEEREPIVVGVDSTHLDIIENDLKFSINLSSGQKTGWFFDHRENRHEIARLARDKRVMDYYCYSGGFSIQAAKAGARQVVGVDRSEAAIQNAKNSAALNGSDVSEKTTFVVAEVFKDMEQRIDTLQKFDIVILDPPAFVKSKKDLAAGLKGYEKLIYKGLQILERNGFLLIASCSYHVKLEDLKNCLARALAKLMRDGIEREPRILKQLQAGPDHPLHPMLAESEYLKGFLVAVNYPER